LYNFYVILLEMINLKKVWTVELPNRNDRMFYWIQNLFKQSITLKADSKCVITHMLSISFDSYVWQTAVDIAPTEGSIEK
jgi:hypothetical protein